MTGYQSKRAAARDKLDNMEREALRLVLETLENPNLGLVPHNGEWLSRQSIAITAIKEALAQPAQEPVAWMNPSWIDPDTRGWQSDSFESIPIEGWLPIYTTPPQRPWVEPTGNEWFEWWRVSQVANETEAEIDFGDFILIAQAVAAKLKESNA